MEREFQNINFHDDKKKRYVFEVLVYLYIKFKSLRG